MNGRDGFQQMQSNMEKNFFIHESAYVDDHVDIGEGTKIWHFSHVQTGSKIGKNCSLGQNVNIGNNVKIGDHVKIQNNVSVYEGVELDDYVFCGPSMVFTNILNPRSEFPQRGSEHYLKTRVKKSASLGANCTIVCGHDIGRYAFVGAGSVVTKAVPDYAMVVGVPARLVGWMCACGTKLSFHADQKSEEKTSCTRCGRHYQKSGNKVEQL
jgi:UDP-2-acetamido-3-amino-2,3-dideoxy-glucuronate N-acetyltransferase